MTLALATAAGLSQAHAGAIAYQDVVFTTNWTNNVLTLEIDAARHSGDWARASMLGALSLKDVGSFSSVSVTAAPAGVEAWKLSSKELNAKGCAGGGASRTGTALCLSGAPVALTDDMVFTFAFTGGTPDLDEPHLKVSFLDASQNKVGDLLSQTIKSTPVVVAQAVTPARVTPVPATPPLPATPPPATSEPAAAVAAAPSEPVALPSSGHTTVTAAGESLAVAMPPPESGTTALVIEPASQQSSGEVPEPQSIALLLGGLVLMAGALRKRG
jgi:hypothetical protein